MQMKNVNPLFLVPCFLFVFVLTKINTGFCQERTSSKSLPLFELGQDSKEFLMWLDQIGAKDILADCLANYPQQTKQILHAGQLLLDLRRFDKVTSLLEKKHFANNNDEFKRFWILFQATKKKGEYPDSLSWLARMSKLPPEQTKVLVRRKYLDIYIRSVCLRFFWNSMFKNLALLTPGTGSLSDLQPKEPYPMNWARVIKMGCFLWPKDPFFKMLSSYQQDRQHQLFKSENFKAYLDKKTNTAPLVAKLFACLVLGNKILTDQALKDLPQGQRIFWQQIVQLISAKKTLLLSEVKNLSPLAQSFLELYSSDLKDLQFKLPVQNNIRWNRFIKQLTPFSPDQQLLTIEKELTSSLLLPEDRRLLNDLYLALLVVNVLSNHVVSNQGICIASYLQQHPLPKNKGLLFALVLTGQLDPKTFFRTLPPRQWSVFMHLCRAAIFCHSSLFSDFWTKKLSPHARVRYPLDELLNYAALDQALPKQYSPALAQEIILCFPATKLSDQAWYFLARKALQEKNRIQSLFFLSKIPSSSAISSKVLQTKADILLEQGKKRQAFELYHKLITSNPETLNKEKRLKIAVLAQELGLWTWADSELARIWQERKSLSPALQAETLFWRAEGFQSLNQPNKALKLYLFLAWHYPQENIWALTALYRAALIYEQKGMFSTAHNLLARVVKKAERKSQKRAAQERIKAIKAKNGRIKNKPSWLWIY